MKFNATGFHLNLADLLGHTTTEITELYYVKKDNTKLEGLTDAFNL